MTESKRAIQLQQEWQEDHDSQVDRIMAGYDVSSMGAAETMVEIEEWEVINGED